ncbi:hypothetical protein RD110_02120 [Rhodoferax koreense]|uniref:DUF1993 domain-containing protein n=1 Tax=Rhodoferax koreensis TaxID=1842727 RepID=A0A1P8JQW5_9BURK|nr:DUF1993 domain-containing protein [Rhodoferax koreense]APW36154.1 hypothetical protein RD110_02120 [Rhodoferax koreense]
MSPIAHRLSIPVYLRGLGVLSSYLDKAEAFAASRGVDAKTLVDARLAPDMLNLAGQIQRASDTSKNAIARLTGGAAPRFEDNETSIAELRERIAKTRAFLQSVDEPAFDGSETREIALKTGKLDVTFTGLDFLLQFALPNFFFHVATAHAILRQQGVPVGKTDYLGPFA